MNTPRNPAPIRTMVIRCIYFPLSKPILFQSIHPTRYSLRANDRPLHVRPLWAECRCVCFDIPNSCVCYKGRTRMTIQHWIVFIFSEHFPTTGWMTAGSGLVGLFIHSTVRLRGSNTVPSLEIPQINDDNILSYLSVECCTTRWLKVVIGNR